MKKQPIRPWAAVLIVAAVMTGCEAGTENGPETAAAPSTETSVIPVQADDGSAVAEAARRELSERLGQPIDRVEVLETRSVYWRSAALGCPDPEKSYSQVLTKGWFIRLAVGRSEYRYHAGETGDPFACDPRWAEPPMEYAAE